MSSGTIKRLVPDRGFGFIAGEDGKEYFFHRSALSSDLSFDTIRDGEAVTFSVEQGDKGPRATGVQKA